MWPHPTPGLLFKQTWIYMIWGCFHSNLGFPGLIVLRRRFLKIFSIYKNLSPIVVPPYPQGPWFEQTWIYIIWGWLHANLSFLGQIVIKRIFLKIFSIYSCIKFIPQLWPHPTPRDHDFTKLKSTLSEDASILILAFLA